MRSAPAALACLAALACADGTTETVTFSPVYPDLSAETGISLKGVLSLPHQNATESRQLAAVILVHGLSADNRQVKFIADSLNQRGFAALRLDVRGHGNSTGRFPHENPDSFCIAANDVRGALVWLRGRPEIDSTRIGLVGLSLGGGAVLALASENSIATVAWYPGLTYQCGGDSIHRLELKPGNHLVIHGTADEGERTAPELASRLATVNPDLSLVWVEGGRHGYGGERLTYLRHTLDSLQRWLSSGAPR